MQEKTFTVADTTVTIKSRIKVRAGTVVGFVVDVNGERFHIHSLSRKQAESAAYVAWSARGA